MATFSPTSSCIEGFRVAGKHPGALVIWGLFYVLSIVLVIGLILLAMGPGFMDAMKNAGANAAASTDPTAALKMVGGMFLGFLIAIPLFMVVVTMLNAAVFRAVLRPEQKGFGYLSLGGDEMRMIVVALVMGVLFFIMYIACVMIWAMIIGGTAVAAGAASGSRGGGAAAGVAGLIGFLFSLVLVCAFIYVAVKLSLASVMTFAEKRIRIFESWGLTKGQFWPLFAMYLLVLLIVIGVALGVMVLSGIFTAMMGVGMFAAFSGHTPQLAAAGPVAIVGIVLYVVVTALHAALQMAIVAAPQAAAYQQLSGSNKAAEAF
ncbi:MAG TPA: hypothetical protein VGL66_06865 [Caulobacteraceae bacterium]